MSEPARFPPRYLFLLAHAASEAQSLAEALDAIADTEDGVDRTVHRLDAREATVMADTLAMRWAQEVGGITIVRFEDLRQDLRRWITEHLREYVAVVDGVIPSWQAQVERHVTTTTT